VTLAALTLGPIEFLRPIWLALVPLLWALTVWLSRRSLSGLGGTTRRVAVGVRLVVIALVAGAVAEPQLRKQSRDVAVSVILDASRSVPVELQVRADRFIDQATAEKKPDDRRGLIATAREAYVQNLPSRRVDRVERRMVGATDGTNLASAVQLALATASHDAANRILLVSDGNETEGSLVRAAEAARAAGVPIDVLPLRYRYDNEVIADRLVAPVLAREGEIVPLRVVLTATRPAHGRLSILMNDHPMDLDPDSPEVSVPVELRAGTNVLSVPVQMPSRGAHQFRAVFEPELTAAGVPNDGIVENNQALAVTFVSGEGRVLVLRSDRGEIDESAALVGALAESEIRAEVRTPESAPVDLAGFTAYDAVIMVNQAAYDYSEAQQQALRQYVHDTGGGLLMVGGDQSFGAGGWIGSPLEDALPIRLDPPQKRQMPRGALALVIHSVEMPNGVFYGKQVCNAAVDALSRLDYVGIVEYGWQAGTDWTFPLQPKGDGMAVKQAINRLVFGDMPSFDPSLQLALQGLLAVDAGQRHVIVISDGDPSLSTALLDQYRANRVTISAVGVYPHSMRDLSTMKLMATRTGGEYYEVTTNAALASLPQIFVKEAQVVRRSLIWEGPAFAPAMTGFSETTAGIDGLPPITGYVVAAEREGLAQVTIRGKENDPIGAQWQYGLGRVVTFTSDATARWATNWLAWGKYKQFWEQHTRWTMRPSGSANLRVTTEDRGDQTLVVVDAVDAEGRRLPSAIFRGRVAGPGGSGVDVGLRQVGPGRFEALVPTSDAGTYVMSLRYYAPPTEEGGPATEGTVQAAITRPFAEEFRSLQDNTAVLMQVAEMTGGRVLSLDAPAAATDLWRREGLTMPVATTPIWLYVAIAGLGLFVMDVAVRRVRIDVLGAFKASRKALERSKAQAGMKLETLQAARQKAHERMTTRPESSDPDLARSGGTGGTGSPAPEVAKRKFEASAEQMARGASGPVALGGEPMSPDRPTQAAPKPSPEDEDGEAGMSRLRKAKQRAREGMEGGEE